MAPLNLRQCRRVAYGYRNGVCLIVLLLTLIFRLMVWLEMLLSVVGARGFYELLNFMAMLLGTTGIRL